MEKYRGPGTSLDEPTPMSKTQDTEIRIRRSADRGHADHGWLQAYHTFSFADYHDPQHMHWGPMRVLNQDTIQPDSGFGTHGHKDMEIVTYVYDGVLEHRDSMGNGSQLHAGDVQRMSAGRGVEHSEFNPQKDASTSLLQMWVFPRENGTDPGWEEKSYSDDDKRGGFRLLVSPDGRDGSLTIHADAHFYATLLSPGESASHSIGKDSIAFLHVATGSVRIGDDELGPGDGAAIQDLDDLTVTGVEDANVVLWQFPAPGAR